MDTEKLIDSLEKLTVLELNGLVKTLEAPASTPMGWQLNANPPQQGTEHLQPGDAGQIPRLLVAGLVPLPAVLVLVGAATLLWGAAPRATPRGRGASRRP